jgi:uncharacterized membrane protein HdeD (DUF308 family)
VAIDLAKKRPITITILGWLYIVVGALSTVSHFAEFREQRPALNEVVWITVLGAAAIVAGVFMLRGRNWARWLALLWMATHVVISVFHPMRELVIHSVLLLLIAYFLFRREAREYFSAT